MPRYIVNKNAQPNGDHEVHVINNTCGHLPNTENWFELGNHSTCGPAVTKAKQTYRQSNGCAYCCEACNTD